MQKDTNAMSLTDVCKKLGISRTTAYARIKDGTLTPIPDNRGNVTKLPRYKFEQSVIERLAQPRKEV